jgi:hypothetical protein
MCYGALNRSNTVQEKSFRHVPCGLNGALVHVRLCDSGSMHCSKGSILAEYAAEYTGVGEITRTMVGPDNMTIWT